MSTAALNLKEWWDIEFLSLLCIELRMGVILFTNEESSSGVGTSSSFTERCTVALEGTRK